MTYEIDQLQKRVLNLKARKALILQAAQIKVDDIETRIEAAEGELSDLIDREDQERHELAESRWPVRALNTLEGVS